MGHSKAMRVIGDSEVFVATLAGGLCQLGERFVTISRLGVRVQIPFEIIQLDELWQAPGRCRLNLSAVLPELRRDKG